MDTLPSTQDQAEFVSILHQVATKTGTEVVQVDRWLPTGKACAGCKSCKTRRSQCVTLMVPMAAGHVRATRMPH